jgi:DNA modification methylase
MMQIAHGFLLEGGAVVERYPTHKPEWISKLVCGDHGDDQVIIWVTFDEEGDELAARIPHSVHLSGKTKPAVRDEIVDRFRAGDPTAPRVLILKPSMFGMGLNLQSCAVQVFSTITDSFERYYQCIRRSHRYGQTRPVKVYIPLTQLDDAICRNVMDKQSTFLDDARTLEDAVVGKLRPRDTSEVRVVNPEPQVEIDRTEAGTWTMVHADSLAHLPTMLPASVDMAVFSPPFAALYAYSKALGDMGNVRGEPEFRLQWKWFAERLLPVMKPGRVVAIHCKEIIRFANTSGYRHCYDFPSDLREGMVDAGFHYQRRITIEKNPQLEATRNKETSLLHVTALRDAANSMPQTGEYLMVFTAPGVNEVPVTHARDEHSFERHTLWMNSVWQEPSESTDAEVEQWKAFVQPDGPNAVWRGIRETDVLNAQVAKEKADERHVCPLQLSLIDRAVRLWTNPGELVLSPFAGIGSEGWASIGAGRRFYGIELKESYYRTACKFLARREVEVHGNRTFFDVLAEDGAA